MEKVLMGRHVKLSDAAEVLSTVSNLALRDTVLNFIGNRKVDIECRKELIFMLDKVHKKLDNNTEIYPTHFLSKSQVLAISRHNWLDVIPTVITVASEVGGTLQSILAHLGPMLDELGLSHLRETYKSYRGQGVVSGILLLGGYRFKSSRVLGKQTTQKVLYPIEHTELLVLSERIDLAMERCEMIGIMEKKNNKLLKELI